MLKAVMIGSSGHYHYALSVIKNGVDCEIIAMAPGPDGEFSEKVKNEIDAEYFTDYKKMLYKCKPDIAIINPHFCHISECAAQAIKRGINIFCEKPLSTDWSGLRKIEEALEESNARICAMMGMRYDAPFAQLKKVIEGGTLGKIRLIHAQKSYKLGTRPDFYKKRDTYGGTILWVGSHPIDMIYWLTGRKLFKSVSARHSSLGNQNHGQLEAYATMMLEMEGEIMATCNIDYLRPADSDTHGDDRIRIMGDKNWAEIVGGKLFVGGKQVDIKDAGGDIFASFCDELKGEGECSVTTKDSIYITKACLAARDAADSCKIINIGEQNE